MNRPPHKKPLYADLAGAGLSEDQRIHLIGDAVMVKQQVVGTIVDDDGQAPERYKKKMAIRWPGIVLQFEGPGPTPGAYTLKYAPPPNSSS